MESIPTEVIKNETLSLVTLTKNEASYLCCFNSYAQEFEEKRKDLNAKLEDVNKTIDKARDISHVTSTALQWKHRAEDLVDVDVEKEKCFNDLCLNCWSQFRKGRDLAERTLDICKHLERCNFDIVDGPTDLPGIKHQCIPNFMHFDSRESTFQHVKKALEDDKNMVGLHGMGGTGKTSMATQVAAELYGSIFGKVIFLVVSKPPNFKKLRGEISKKLELDLKDEEEEGLQGKILNKINALEEKLLIILDDVWAKFDLRKELGIPHHNQHKGCTILMTTRKEDICKKMDCQSTILLDTLTIEEAMSLFQEHTGSIPILESSAHRIVKHCQGVPVVIVAVARSLKGRPSRVWKEALRALEQSESILNINDHLKRVYEALKLSYYHLENESAKKLFLISSLFPEGSNIPMEILIRIGVGMGPFGEVDDYNERRRKVLNAIMELLDSSLLLNVESECVKMHDLVHEVALLIGENNIQAANESKQLVKEGLQCLLWENDYFPKYIDGTKLESLLILLDGTSPKNLEVPNTLFTEMTKLEVLLVSGLEVSLVYRGWYHRIRISARSLLPSIQTLPNLRTLILECFKLGSISALGMLLNLETLWMIDCSIVKLPGEYFELQKLRFLRIEQCKIKMSNPFELLESCPKLKELTFLSNRYDRKEEDKISQKASFHAFEIYQIFSNDLSDYFEDYGSLFSRCFCPGKLIDLMSEATFKQLASTSELLILKGYEEKKHKNLVPDIIAYQQTKELIILELYSWHGMQCLIDDDVNVRSDVNAFSNLVKLALSDIGLSNILFNGNYELCLLKTMSLKHCGKLKSIFLPSTAQSLSRLEELEITGCDALECIIEHKSLGGEIDADDSGNDQKNYNTLFPKLKILHVSCCGNLEIILPTLPGGVLLDTITIDECQNLQYIFDKFQEINVKNFFRGSMKLFELPSLLGIFKEHEKFMSASMQRLATSSAKTSSFSWTQVFCFKSRATSDEANGVVSTRALLDEGTAQKFDACTNRVSSFHAAQSLLVQSTKHVKIIELVGCQSLISVSILSVAALIVSLEDLTIRGCHKLKNITTHVGDAQVHQDYYSIFPTLVNLLIEDCTELEFLFLSAGSIGLEKLKSLTIEEVPELKYVVGNYQKEQHSSNQNQIDELLHFDLPSLETLKINGAPKINAISQKNYKMVLSSLQNVEMENCNLVNWTATQELHASTNKALLFQSTQSLLNESLKTIKKMTLVNCEHLVSVSNLSIASSTILLEDLTIEACHQLKCIVSNEGDTGTNMNYSSIFPKLKLLDVSECSALEYLFPAYAFRSPVYLESLKISNAPMLNYVFGRSEHEDNLTFGNLNVQTHINFPALKDLSISRVPKLVSIYPKKYYLRGLSLRSVLLKGFPKFTMRPFNGFLVCCHTKQQETKVFEMSHQSLECLTIEDSKIEEFFYVTDLETEESGNRCEPLASSSQKLELLHLSELVNLCVGPKCILSFNSLQWLTIMGCKKLKVIFSTSVVRSLPVLEVLSISDCEDLVQIIEEDYETNVEDHLHPHEPCFPNLKEVIVRDCDKLKYLFSITIDDMFPKLLALDISKAHDLEHVLIRRDDMKQMIMKDDVLPQLKHLFLARLPNLVSVCHGINIQISIDGLPVDVFDCPKFSKTSTAQLQIADSQVKEKAEEKSSSHMSSDQSINIEETTQQSIQKDDLVSKGVKSEVTMTDPSADGTKNLEKVPIHTSPNLTVLPTSGNTNTNAKFFDVEDEEGTLIISRRHRRRRSGKMTGRSLLEEEKLETSIDETITTPGGSEWTEKKLSSHLNGKQAAKTQHPTTSGFSSSNSTRTDTEVNPSVVDRIDSQRTSSKDELVDQEVKEETPMFEPKLQEEMAGGYDKQSHDQKEEQKEASRGPRSCMKPDISLPQKMLETSKDGYLFVPPSPKSSNASTGLAQTPSDDGAKDEGYEVWEGTEQMLSSQAVETQQSTTASSNFTRGTEEDAKEIVGEGIIFEKPNVTNLSRDSKDELVDKVAPNERIMVDPQQSTTGIHNFKENETPNMMEPQSQQETKGHEEEEREGGLVTKHQSEVKVKRPLLKEELEISDIMNASTSFKVVNNEGINKTSVVQNESKTNVACQEAIEMTPFLEANNEASIVPGVQEIIDMMKLEGYERSIFAKALETRPQLQLSTKDRSTRVLYMSYRVLIDILNILTTRTPFTITEADKRLLGEHLKDACLLGFNKDWIESIKTNIFDSELCEVDSLQNILKGLENDLKIKDAMLEAIRDEVVEAERVLEVAQQEHAEVMARHAQLLKARQDLTARRHKCWEIIAAKNRHFGF